jgi:glycosyltransferase involved in cell wall biosynthesis
VTSPPRIAVCVSTFRRQEGLRTLLSSLDALEFDGAPPALQLVVVDNDAEDPVERRLGPVAALTRWPVTYAIEPVRGVVAARNRALAAVPADTDFVAFVDDDERVTPRWLAALLATQAATGADVVQGPVTPEYLSPPPDWVEAGAFFHLGPFVEGQPLPFAATNNTLVRKSAIDGLDHPFDMRFNLTGGEDQEFFDRIRAAGGRIVASAAAEVVESIPASRMTLRWLLRRQYRTGTTIARVEADRGRSRLLRAAKGAGFAALGMLDAASGVVLGSLARRRGVLTAARGVGMLAGLVGLDLREYAQSAVATERASAGAGK